jgi:hypothetical protein
MYSYTSSFFQLDPDKRDNRFIYSLSLDTFRDLDSTSIMETIKGFKREGKMRKVTIEVDHPAVIHLLAYHVGMLRRQGEEASMTVAVAAFAKKRTKEKRVYKGQISFAKGRPLALSLPAASVPATPEWNDSAEGLFLFLTEGVNERFLEKTSVATPEAFRTSMHVGQDVDIVNNGRSILGNFEEDVKPGLVEFKFTGRRSPEFKVVV